MSFTRRFILFAAAGGAAYCVWQLFGFVGTIANNGLAWEGSASFTRDHYLAVGQAYSRGFAVGFFLCFCLAVIAFVVGTWYEGSLHARATAIRTALPPA